MDGMMTPITSPPAESAPSSHRPHETGLPAAENKAESPFSEDLTH
jgi:hypothetical protein